MAALGFELLLRFLWGWLFVLFFISRQETSEKFVRISFWIALGTGVALSALYWLSNDPQLYFFLRTVVPLVAAAFLYSFVTPNWARALSFLILLAFPWTLPHQTFFSCLNFFSSGLLLGSVFMGQNLGHWFLRVPGMNIRELIRVSNLLIFALSLKTLEVLATLLLAAPPIPAINEMGQMVSSTPEISSLTQFNPDKIFLNLAGDFFGGLSFFGFLLLSARVLWGILALALFAYMIRSTVKTRSTQSATGILYAASVAVLVGEGAALYLHFSLGWNL